MTVPKPPQSGPGGHAKRDDVGDPESEGQGPEQENDLFLVAIGSSAGGFEPAKEILSSLPPDSGLAFCLVPHLDPSHESHLVGLLQRHTKMQVMEAKDGMPVRPDTVIVIPPDAVMVVKEGVLRLKQRERSADKRGEVIDIFFRSVADGYGEHAVGVVLSGALSDGAQGIRDIKAVGGFALAQSPGTATFSEMPRAALETGVVDVVADPVHLAQRIVELKQADAERRMLEEGRSDEGLERDLDAVLEALYAQTGRDFREYKRATLMRRVHRRMIATKTSSLKDYVRIVQGSPEEAKRLVQEFLIIVTRFFRDVETDQTLAEKILPELVKNRSYDDPLRVWVPGCATGEEAYSLAILITEHLKKHNLTLQVQVFATDLSGRAIQTAREAVYPEVISQDVPEKLLARYFEPSGGGYRLRNHIRGLCIFSEHDLVRDPPFSNMDLVSCRNVLVYMGPTLQRRVFGALHHALKSGGVLVLGTSETKRQGGEMFSPLEGARNVLRKRDVSPRRGGGPVGHVTSFAKTMGGVGLQGPRGESGIKEVAEQVMLDRHAPPGVIVDETMRIVRFQGPSIDFLEHPSGTVTLDLTKLVPYSLAISLRGCVKESAESNGPVGKDVTFDHGGRTRRIMMEVVPLHAKTIREHYYLITFQHVQQPPTKVRVQRHPQVGVLAKLFGLSRKSQEEEIARLHKELAEAQEHLMDVKKGHDAAIEELRSVNEEATSTNQELHSTNEKLETMQEELQSTNEELTTLNEELVERNKDQQELNNDLENLLLTVDLPILLLDSDLRIRRFSRKTAELFGLIHKDVGRPLTDVQSMFDTTDLKTDLQEVVHHHRPIERTVEGRDKEEWHMRIHPYQTPDDAVEGLVIVVTQQQPQTQPGSFDQQIESAH